MKYLISIAALALPALLAACGGDSAAPIPPAATAPPPVPPVPPAPPPAPEPPVPPPPPLAEPPVSEPPVAPPPAPGGSLLDYFNVCVARPGSKPGTLRDEQNFLRLWIDDTYLWYREVPPADMQRYDSATAYFDVLKTPLLTPSGQPKDRFHFSYPDARWRELSAGVQLGYGIGWVRAGNTVPRDWRIATVAPDSAAARAGLRRGDQLATVDGIDFAIATGADVDRLNAALSPVASGETHRFTLRRGSGIVPAALVSAQVNVAPVQNTRVIATPTGPVGYLTFGNHVLWPKRNWWRRSARCAMPACATWCWTCATTVAACSASPARWAT